MSRASVQTFFDEATFTATHVVWDPCTGKAAIIDSVMDYDAASGALSTGSAEALVAFIEAEGLCVEWLLETHIHADHLSAAWWLKERVGGQLAMGARVTEVQEIFKEVFNADDLRPDGSQFDHLFADNELFELGDLPACAMPTPGHTPACMSYLIGDCCFVGDTLFMPDFGTARCDFPGGSAATLFQSIRRILALPPETRLFVGHDYKAPGREDFAWETTVGAQRAESVHVKDGVDEADFVEARETRDATLGMPRLLLPSVQVNMRAGDLPPAADNGRTYLMMPVTRPD